MRCYEYATMPLVAVLALATRSSHADSYLSNDRESVEYSRLLSDGFRWIRSDGDVAVFERESRSEPLRLLESIVSRAELVPCKNGGEDASQSDVVAGIAMQSGKWRVESAVDGWIVEARELIEKSKAV